MNDRQMNDRRMSEEPVIRGHRAGPCCCLALLLFLAPLLLSGLHPFGTAGRQMAVLLGSGVARAVEPDEILADPALENRARALSRVLRCVVCQNQSIDLSDAEIARDMRILVRQRLLAGDTDAQAVAFLVDRYGEFVRLKPSVRLETAPLWFGPPVLAAVVLLMLLFFFRGRQNRQAGQDIAPLSAADRARLDTLAEELANRPARDDDAGQQTGGQQTDGQQTDGQQTDGQQTDGQQTGGHRTGGPA